MFFKSHTQLLGQALILCFLFAGNNVSALAEDDASRVGIAGNQTASQPQTTAMQQSRIAAQTAYHAMQFESALQQYRNICQSPVHDANDLYWLGESYFHLGEFVHAAQTFELSLASSPRADGLRVRVVQCYLACKQPQTAREKIAAALNVVTDPLVRQQLNSLSRYCDNPPSFHINNVSHFPPGARVAER